MFSRPTIDWEINIKSQRISRQQDPFSFPSLLLPLLSFFFSGLGEGVGGGRDEVGDGEGGGDGGGDWRRALFVFSKMGIFLEGIFFFSTYPQSGST